MRVPGLANSEGTPKNILPNGEYVFEVVGVKIAEKKSPDGVVTGHNWNFRFTVEDALQEDNERVIGANFFHNVFVMTEDHPKFDEPLAQDISGRNRTIGNLGVDQLADVLHALQYEADGDEVEVDDLNGLKAVGRIRTRKNEETEEPENYVSKWKALKED